MTIALREYQAKDKIQAAYPDLPVGELHVRPPYCVAGTPYCVAGITTCPAD